MSSKNVTTDVVSVDEQAFESAGEQAVDEEGFEVVDETPEFEAAVEQETQAKVDANHPDGIADTSDERIHGVTLEQEERIQAREPELERISAQAELRTQDGREQRTREVVSELSGRDEPAPTERTDPREELTQDELAEVNRQAMRISDEVQGGWSRAVRREAAGREGGTRSGRHEGGAGDARRGEGGAGGNHAHCGCAGRPGR